MSLQLDFLNVLSAGTVGEIIINKHLHASDFRRFKLRLRFSNNSKYYFRMLTIILRS